MPHYRTAIATSRSPEDAFHYMAAFEHIADWDPSVVEAARIGSGALGPGTRFGVVVSSAGRPLRLDYEITEFEAPHHVLLVAETTILRSADRITVEAAPDGATVAYDAQLELRGLLRVFNPALAVVFRRIADRAAAGLRRELRA